MSQDLGPLPKGDRPDTLQQLSIKAFRNLLPEDQFLFRDERVDDKGVDGALEVKVAECFTNCRAQVQLKSTDADPNMKGDFNADRSYSLSIDTANLNYLLNGPSPLYVIWLSKLNEFRFAWAHDEWQKLDASNPDWRKQGSFTIRFSNLLTAAELPGICDRIVGEAQLHRRIHESMARSAPAEEVVVSINANTLESTAPNELYERLSKSGMTIVAAGYGKKVLEWYALLNPDRVNEARLRLVAAFAASSIGKYHEAKGYLAGVVSVIDELSDDDRQFLEYLSGVCNYHTGRIDEAEYLRMEAEWASRFTGIRAAEHHLEVLRHERLSERSAERREQLLHDMRALVDQIEFAPDAHAAQKIQSRLMLLSAEGDDLNTQFIEDFGRITMRENMGFSAEAMARDAAEGAADRWTDWEKRAASLRDQAIETGHPLLIADCMTARIKLYMSFLLLSRMNALARATDERPAQGVVDGLKEDATQAIEVYELAGSLTGELQVKMLLADLHGICENEEEAQQLANSILPVARAMDYQRLASQAIEHLERRTVLHRFVEQLQHQPTDDEIALSQSDEDIRAMARMTLASLGIPEERLLLVEKDCFAGRAIAQERRDWCRHLELHQNLSHTQHSETAYHVDPDRVCVCAKLRHQSNIPHPDYETIISAFKRACCDGCVEREPRSSL